MPAPSERLGFPHDVVVYSICEIEMISDSLMNNNGTSRGNNAIKYIPDQSVVKLQVGDKIRLTQADFERHSAAFFGEIERKFL